MVHKSPSHQFCYTHRIRAAHEVNLARGVNGVRVRGVADRVHQRLSVLLAQRLIPPVEVFHLIMSLTYRTFQTHCEEMSLEPLPPAKRTKAMAWVPLASVITFFAMIFGASLCPSANPNMRGPRVSNFSSNSLTPRMSAKNACPLQLACESKANPVILLWRITCQLPRHQ